MKKMSYLVWLVSFLALLLRESMADTGFAGFAGLGSVSNAYKYYAVPGSKILSISVYQRVTDGFVTVGRIIIDISFTNREALDAFYQKELARAAQGALTNTMTDRDKPFGVLSFTTRSFPSGLWINYLGENEELSLIKSNGTYLIPDLTHRKMGLATDFVFEIPGLEWARIEAFRNPNVSPFIPDLFWENDSRYNEPWYIDVTNSNLMIEKGFAISGTNGPTLLKISLVTRAGTNHIFQVFGPMGNQIPETPIRCSSVSISNNAVSMKIIGGDPGRILQVQCASNPSGPWSDIGNKFVVQRYGIPSYFESSTINSTGKFFRVRAVDGVPW